MASQAIQQAQKQKGHTQREKLKDREVQGVSKLMLEQYYEEKKTYCLCLPMPADREIIMKNPV